MDIGTAKPSAALLSELPHSLVDIRDPREQFTAGDFTRLASEAIEEIRSRDSMPVVSGGTAFYIKSLVCGMAESPPSDPAIRAAVASELALRGAPALHAELARVDPVSAARIHVRDLYRLTRAIEVFRQAGRPLSSFDLPSSPSDGFILLSLERPRDELYARIDARVDAMMAAGLEAEVECLRDSGYVADDPGMRGIGYREFFESWRADGEAGFSGGGQRVVDAIKTDTRRYAKRQLTFFRTIPGIRSVAPGDARSLFDAATACA